MITYLGNMKNDIVNPIITITRKIIKGMLNRPRNRICKVISIAITIINKNNANMKSIN
jgi:hypothetical protein